MNIHEYQAKQVLAKFGVNVPNGLVALNKDEIDSQIDKMTSDVIVVKAQIHAGGRGKAGGVKVTKSKDEAKKAAHAMWNMNLVTHQTGPNGQVVQRLYFEEGSRIATELYLSLVLDRAKSCVTIIASTEGGMDIEEVAESNPEKIVEVNVNPVTGISAYHCRKVAFALGLSGAQFKECVKIVDSLYHAFMATDANQIEINPLVITEDEQVVALDAKMNFDANALYRQKEIYAMRDEAEEDPLEVRAANAELSYVKMDGNIGCMVNGAGLAMSTMDIIKLYGAEPANFLDVGGGADQARVTEAFKIILSDENVKGILINIFGGIMRCDIIAEGVVAAAKEVGLAVPLVVRLAGTNFELGKEILDNSGLDIVAANDLGEAAEKIVNLVK